MMSVDRWVEDIKKEYKKKKKAVDNIFDSHHTSNKSVTGVKVKNK